MVKAQSGIIAVPLILLTIAFAIVSTDVVFFWERSVTKEVNIQATTYTMWNALKAADIYMNTSLDYSVYQACYDILKRGGFKEDGKNWSNSEDDTEAPPGEEEFEQNFHELVQEYTDRYTSQPYNFVKGYNVTGDGSDKLPDMQVTLPDMGYTGFTVSAESENSLSIRNEIDNYMEEISLKKKFQAQKTYEIPCFGLFYWAKNNNHEEIRTVLEQEVEKEMEAWPVHNEKQYSESCDSTESRIEEVRNEIFYEVVEQIIAPDVPMGGYTPIQIDEHEAIKESIKKIESNIDIGISLAFLEIGEGYRYYLVPDTETVVEIDPKCTAASRDGGCYYSCDFDYDLVVALRTEFHLDEEEYYPVASGKYPGFDRMQLIITDRMTYSK